MKRSYLYKTRRRAAFAMISTRYNLPNSELHHSITPKIQKSKIPKVPLQSQTNARLSHFRFQPPMPHRASPQQSMKASSARFAQAPAQRRREDARASAGDEFNKGESVRSDPRSWRIVGRNFIETWRATPWANAVAAGKSSSCPRATKGVSRAVKDDRRAGYSEMAHRHVSRKSPAQCSVRSGRRIEYEASIQKSGLEGTDK